jgi:hypothetical protein
MRKTKKRTERVWATKDRGAGLKTAKEEEIWTCEIYCSIYNTNITLLVGTLEAMRGWLQAHHDESAERLRLASAKTIEITDDASGSKEWVMWFPTWTDDRTDLLKLVHESGHVVHQLFRQIGFKIHKRSNEEPFTYFQTDLVRECWDALSDYAAKPKRKKARARR